MKEIERRFLLRSFPDYTFTKTPTIIEDHKIITGEPHPQLRLRRIDENYELTKKYKAKAHSRIVMLEETIQLSKLEFEAFLKLDKTSQKKKRYTHLFPNYKAEIDIWEDELKGLCVIEFEFKNVVNAVSFTPPEFCLIEITENEALAAGLLSGKSFEDIKQELETFGFKKLVIPKH